MNQALAVMIGGAVGSLARFYTIQTMHLFLGRGFPYGTLAVNVVGSLLMGVLYVILVERGAVSGEWRELLIVGFLGGFTTFSAFSMDTVALLEQQAYARAALNVVLSVTICVAATSLGVMVTRRL